MVKKASMLALFACVAVAGCAPDYAYNPYPPATQTIVAGTPIPPAPMAPAYQVATAGSVVGFPVMDASGYPIGTVAAVVADRATGTAINLIVGGPNFGPGFYVSVPAVNAQMLGDRVVVSSPAQAWLQAPRYGRTQLSQLYGPF